MISFINKLQYTRQVRFSEILVLSVVPPFLWLYMLEHVVASSINPFPEKYYVDVDDFPPVIFRAYRT